MRGGREEGGEEGDEGCWGEERDGRYREEEVGDRGGGGGALREGRGWEATRLSQSWQHNGGGRRAGYRRPHGGSPALPDGPRQRPRPGQLGEVPGPQTEIRAVSFEGV